MNFFKGDRVMMINPDYGEAGSKDLLVYGMCGTVLEDFYGDRPFQVISVEWDNYVDGHAGFAGSGKDGYCWNVEIACIELLSGPAFDEEEFLSLLCETECAR